MATAIGVPGESAPNERRVAATPESVHNLREAGFEVLIEQGAGTSAGFSDEAYEAAGAKVVDRAALFSGAQVVLKVRPPGEEEVGRLPEGATLISLLQPERQPPLTQWLCARKITALALERIPRVTRAQKMDVLSSMANLAGYRAVVEAAALYRGFFGPQITAAGASPPARVLVIGAGVAGLAAVAAARALGAEVRAFDTRAATREQVESLGGTFLEVDLEEAGEGGGGYAKVMSPEFIAAEMALFRAQAKEVDIVITTALVPGTKAPVLLAEDVVACLKPGSVVVDMAAEQGGNCALTVPDQVVERGGVKVAGYTDLASRMAGTASRFFANNLVHLLKEMGGGQAFRVDLEDEVIRPAVLTHGGEVLPPPPKPAPAPPPPAPKDAPAQALRPVPPEKAPAKARGREEQIMNPIKRAWGTTFGGLVVIILLFFAGRFAPQDFLRHFTVFILACFVGWQVIWSVTPALHTPLMSVTNAISGIIILGGLLQVGPELDLATVLGALAVLVAAVNVAGGFWVTQRMLRMFQKGSGS